MKYDVVAFGGCYLDINSSNLPFNGGGIPVEKEIRGNQYQCIPGGSAINFLRTLKRLERSGLFLGMKGEDTIGDLTERLIAKEGLSGRLIPAKGRRTNIGLNMVGENGDHVVFSIGNANQALEAALIIPELEEVLPRAAFLYMGTLFKLDGLSRNFLDIISLARNNGTKVVIDHGRITPGVPTERFAEVRAAVLAADYYLPSRVEFLETWGTDTISDGLKLVRSKAPSLVTVVKDGANGAHYLDGDNTRTIPAFQITSADNVTGAGDTFNAGFIASLLADPDLSAAVRNGCEAAAWHIGHGTPAMK
jgi:2-dehydro-3-deoxygluconokinase